MSRQMTVEEGILTCIAEISARDARIAALEAQLADSVKTATIDGWNACRKSIYAVCEDVTEQADWMEPNTNPRNEAEAHHAKGYYAGQRYTAKSIARGFGAMRAEDDDNLIAALSALEATPPAPNVTDAHPLAMFGSDTVVPLGLYRVHWKSGGSSLAAIGMMENGDRWIAPTNWTRPGLVASAGEWGEIERLDPIEGPAPKVTEEMVEAASREYMRIFDKHLLSEHARLILTAAQEAGK